MRKTLHYGIALAAALTLVACSKHGDNQAEPADAAGNASADPAGADNAAGAVDATGESGTNALDANAAEPGNAATDGGNTGG